MKVAKETVQLLIPRIKNPEDKNSDSIIVPTELYKGDNVKLI